MLPTRGQRTHTNASTLRKILLSKRKKRNYVYKKKIIINLNIFVKNIKQ